MLIRDCAFFNNKSSQIFGGGKVKKISSLLLIILVLLLVVTGCTSTEAPGEKGQEIITAKEALKVMSNSNVVLVDMQSLGAYEGGHVKGAVSITTGDINVSVTVPTMHAPAEQIEKVLDERGISNDSTVIVYDDNNNMNAGRLWWTMKMYGHENVKVVSGGLNEMVKAGAEITNELSVVKAVNYRISEKNEKFVIDKEGVLSLLNNPQDDVVLLDVRTPEEYRDGTIPGSVHINYIYNNFPDGTFRPISQIHTLFRDKGITPEKTIIIYCKSSMRAGNTIVALYNAGYRNLKVYDGAWLEWSADSSLPVEIPDNVSINTNFQDAS